MNDLSKPEFKRPYVEGIDGLRLIAALWVAFSHGLRAPIAELQINHAIWGKILTLANSIFYNGVGAVVIFFIISGFCIHYPNVGKSKIDIKRFLSRRLTRILIPYLAIVLISRILGGVYPEKEDGLLWSVHCEIAYYILYPFFINMHIKFAQVMVVTIAISAFMVITHAHFVQLHEFGVFTWLYCAPAWLAGALLAQNFTLMPSNLPIWAWRLGAIAVSVMMSIMARLGTPFTISTIPVVIFGYFWLKAEFQSYNASPVRNVFEKIGLASYSIYLVHPLPITAVGPYLITSRGYILFHWSEMILAFVVSISVFYFCVERPAHILARKF